ncbi:lasso RiPP family leader peptide-containing protein [Methylacidimicrobium tartarophylax]|uniref:Uncharacterized protein n=1 Tax=Methylacidimicrobium tartarophylax TaxID=1041768 RepID=A0A5E6M6U7_9BACT|nr:lasso RiPP family leader peptide-containing protein [Methylacidimicrobium tartarophylax]VVM04670.1 hypothetical protein MAMT_00222 [Methylacidimicrobium tartarophylax]
MNNDTGKQEINQTSAQGLSTGRKPYTAPRLVVHGSVEALTKAVGGLITDTLLSGSVITTLTLGEP